MDAAGAPDCAAGGAAVTTSPPIVGGPALQFARQKRGRYLRSPPEERTSSDGVVFDSKAELRRWEELRLLQRAGKISGLRRQLVFLIEIDGRPVKIRSRGFPNGRPCKYTADFAYTDIAAGKRVWEEHKGVDSAESRLRRAIVEALYNVEIVVTGAAAKDTPALTGGSLRVAEMHDTLQKA